MAKCEIRHQDRAPNMPDGWSFLGDIFKDERCLGCLFITEKGHIRLQKEGETWTTIPIIVNGKPRPVEIADLK